MHVDRNKNASPPALFSFSLSLFFLSNQWLLNSTCPNLNGALLPSLRKPTKSISLPSLHPHSPFPITRFPIRLLNWEIFNFNLLPRQQVTRLWIQGCIDGQKLILRSISQSHLHRFILSKPTDQIRPPPLFFFFLLLLLFCLFDNLYSN